MLLVELNEFSRALLQNVARTNKLAHLEAMLAWSHTTTWTEDRYETGFLEPWAQWVSVHTGSPSAAHQVKNLGDVPNLAQDQIWERWSRRGIESIVWGVMNGNRRNAEHCRVFIPDPWTFSENTYPAEYQGLIELPRYLAQNYLDFSKLSATAKALRLASTLIKHTKGTDFIDGLRIMWRGLAQFGPKNVVFIVFFEYLSAMAFIRAVETHRPGAAVLFINMLAHVQHHYWKTPDGGNCPQIAFAATAVDEILGKIQRRCHGLVGDGRVAVMNGLSQTCTIDDPPWILYRPNNHAKLIAFLGLEATRVEPLMTYDAHVFFANEAAAQRGLAILAGAKVDGKPLFLAEMDPHNPCKLFYRVAMSDPVSDGSTIVYGNSAAPFAEHFTAIVQRTGKHIQTGDLYSNFAIDAPKLKNHEIFQMLDGNVGAAART